MVGDPWPVVLPQELSSADQKKEGEEENEWKIYQTSLKRELQDGCWRMLEKADICFKINKKVSEEEIACFNEKTVHPA